jgi:membrane peptidoglycan carboxypeptidase
MAATKRSVKRRIFRATLLIALLILFLAGGQLIRQEVLSSARQAAVFAKLAREATYEPGLGQSPAIRFPDAGPYDKRLGYADLPIFVHRLQEKEFEISLQARQSPRLTWLADHQISPPYSEKAQAGLSIRDRRGKTIVCLRYPERGYARFEDIPPIIVRSLLFIENRQILDPRYPKRNPAIEWPRLARAVSQRTLQSINLDERSAGGSTLATQMEKYRHSPDGRTGSVREKFRQMASASLRAYRHGEDTSLARREIVVDYLNSMPLSARPGYGEINGFGDGLWAWYGRELASVSRILSAESETTDDDKNKTSSSVEAKVYKQALSLLIAQRRPSHFFDGNHQQLEQLTNSYLRLMASAGVIPAALSNGAQAMTLDIAAPGTAPAPGSFSARKTGTTLRTHLAGLLGVSRLYDLDRLDLDVGTSLDLQTQEAIASSLRGIRSQATARSAGLYGKQLLGGGDPAQVVYSFTLYERGEDANYLRVQTDNLDDPFDINSGAKLDLGSTAKLRTVVTYLDIVADLHRRYGTLDPVRLRTVLTDPQDHISHWAVEYLKGRHGVSPSLRDMLEAALDRSYSASPHEQFFTGSGQHSFANFRHEDDGRILSVREGLRNSVNLVFVRLLRDIAYHYVYQSPAWLAGLLRSPDDPRRNAYLSRFADQEGRQFIQRFYRKYRGRAAADMEDVLLQGVIPTPPHLASVLRSIAPDAPVDELAAFLQKNLPSNKLSEANVVRLYEQYSPQHMSLGDRGYVAGVHPLELWLTAFLRSHPGASLAEVIDASVGERQAVYQWLFSARRKHAQDKRIRSLLEVEAFFEIHRRWQRLGYPFSALVPSYATALGASGDRPAALAELMGIIVNDGLRKPSVLVESLHFAKGSPYETLLKRPNGNAERVLPAEVAQAVRALLRDVVDNGTAKRAKGVFVGLDGSAIPLGGKTGTGDRRFDVFGRHGKLVESRVMSRSATFVFSIGDRFYGTITAYVPGKQAAHYDFTSALPVQLLKVLAPKLHLMLEAPVTASESSGSDLAPMEAGSSRCNGAIGG